MDMELLQGFLDDHTCCRKCAEWHLGHLVGDFVAYADADETSRSLAELEVSFRHARSRSGRTLKQHIGSLEVDSEELIGVASEMTFKCHRPPVHGPCSRTSGPTARPLHGNRHLAFLSTSKQTGDTSVPLVAQYEVNPGIVIGASRRAVAPTTRTSSPRTWACP